MPLVYLPVHQSGRFLPVESYVQSLALAILTPLPVAVSKNLLRFFCLLHAICYLKSARIKYARFNGFHEIVFN